LARALSGVLLSNVDLSKGSFARIFSQGKVLARNFIVKIFLAGFGKVEKWQNRRQHFFVASAGMRLQVGWANAPAVIHGIP